MIKKILRENYLYLLIIIVLLLIFFVVKNSYLMNYIDRFDHIVIDYINSLPSSIVYPMIIITNIGYWYVPLILVLVLFLVFKDKRYCVLIALCYAFSAFVAFVGKVLISRPRPSVALIDIPNSLSFPSGHTLTSLSFYCLFSYILCLKLNKNEKVVYFITFTIIGLLVGFSRIYLGVHYFSDVIGGIILYIPCILMFINIINKNYREDLE